MPRVLKPRVCRLCGKGMGTIPILGLGYWHLGCFRKDYERVERELIERDKAKRRAAKQGASEEGGKP